jgi:chromosome segregation ATPase
MSSSPSKGIVRMNWNLRSNSTNSINAESNGFLVPPGTYFVSISLVHNGSVEELVAKQSFIVKGLNNQTLMAKNSNELVTFRNEVAALSQQLSNASNWMSEAKEVLENMESSLKNYPNTELALLSETRALKLLYDNCATALWGDRIKSSREFETPPSINDRLGMVEYQLYENTAGVSTTHKANKVIVEEQFTALSASLADMSKRIQVLQHKLALVPIPFTKSLSHFWK